MSTEDVTRRVVQGYFDAWTSSRVAEAFDLLSPNLRFVGPSAQYASAEEFRPALVAFAALSKGARIAELLISKDRAAMLYDCDMPAPVGTLRIASFFRVEEGKIREYETLFDPTELRKLQERARSAPPSKPS